MNNTIMRRADAAKQGLTKFLGHPCSKCGHNLRYTINGACTHCQAEWLRNQRKTMRKQIINHKEVEK